MDRLLGEHGLQQDTPEARQEFERRTEARRLGPGDPQALQSLRRGWCLGSEEFKQQKLEDLDGQVGQHHFGQMRLEVAQAKAERIITEELRRLGWQEAQLESRRKRDPAKLAIAMRLRKETTLSVKEIAARLHLGTPGSASVCLLAALRKSIAGLRAQPDIRRHISTAEMRTKKVSDTVSDTTTRFRTGKVSAPALPSALRFVVKKR